MRNLKTDVQRTLKVPLKVNASGRPRKISTQEGALLLLREKALKGYARALDRLLEFARLFNNEARRNRPRPGAVFRRSGHSRCLYGGNHRAFEHSGSTLAGGGALAKSNQKLKMNKAIVLAALLRTELRFFVWKVLSRPFCRVRPISPNWHVHAIVHPLMRVHAGDISRLVINQPPRSLKSICVSVA